MVLASSCPNLTTVEDQYNRTQRTQSSNNDRIDDRNFCGNNTTSSQERPSRDRSEILSNTHHNKHLAFEAFEHHHLIMSEKITVSVMDPQPGHLFVEFHKDGGDGSSTKEKADSGLDVEFKAKHGKHRIYLSKVEHPASSKLHGSSGVHLRTRKY